MVIKGVRTEVRPMPTDRCWRIYRITANDTWHGTEKYPAEVGEAMLSAAEMEGLDTDTGQTLAGASRRVAGAMAALLTNDVPKGAEFVWLNWRARPANTSDGTRYWVLMRRPDERATWRDFGSYPTGSKTLLGNLVEFELKTSEGTLAPMAAAARVEALCQSLGQVVADA